MLKIKLIKIGNKKTSIFSIISIDSRKVRSRNTKKLGFIDRIQKKLHIKKDILFEEIKKGVSFSYGFIKLVRSLKNKSFINKYEIKIL
ncbi:30S ribosomal protein S16 [Candidatus Vidania fulgoroideae]|nr:30S ribosomal protein S16 [Candidatus Vidania fulgoroideae]